MVDSKGRASLYSKPGVNVRLVRNRRVPPIQMGFYGAFTKDTHRVLHLWTDSPGPKSREGPGGGWKLAPWPGAGDGDVIPVNPFGGPQFLPPKFGESDPFGP